MIIKLSLFSSAGSVHFVQRYPYLSSMLWAIVLIMASAASANKFENQSEDACRIALSELIKACCRRDEPKASAACIDRSYAEGASCIKDARYELAICVLLSLQTILLLLYKIMSACGLIKKRHCIVYSTPPSSQVSDKNGIGG